MNGIGWAVKEMHNGMRVTRPGWNGKGMWLALHFGSPGYLAYVYMQTATGDVVPWVCSQTDLLAMDWEIAA